MFLIVCIPLQKKLNENLCGKKEWKLVKSKRIVGAVLSFCTHQYLFVSDYLWVILKRGLFSPPLELLDSSGRSSSENGLLIWIAEGGRNAWIVDIV